MQETSKIIRLVFSTLSWIVICVAIVFALYSNNTLSDVVSVQVSGKTIFWEFKNVLSFVFASLAVFFIFEAIHTLALHFRSEKEVDDYNEKLTAGITTLIGAISLIATMFISLSNIFLMNGIEITTTYTMAFIIAFVFVCLCFFIFAICIRKTQKRGGKYIDTTQNNREITVSI